MANESRFKDRRLLSNDGFVSQNNVGVFVDGDGTIKNTGPVNINDTTAVKGVISATATFSMAATLGVVGSLNFSTSIDVPLAGAVVGDVVLCRAVASVGYDLLLNSAVLTANYVRMVGSWTGTTGAHAAVNLAVRLVGFRF